jgi:hypothetical protein
MLSGTDVPTTKCVSMSIILFQIEGILEVSRIQVISSSITFIPNSVKNGWLKSLKFGDKQKDSNKTFANSFFL